MPRFLRPFWGTIDSPTRSKLIGSGPGTKDGGMSMDLYVAKEGHVHHAVDIRCEVISGRRHVVVAHEGQIVVDAWYD